MTRSATALAHVDAVADIQPDTAIHYSRGTAYHDAHPTQHTAADFREFARVVLADRSTGKGQSYVCAPFKANGDGRPHRCKAGALPTRVLSMDFDGIDPAVLADLHGYLTFFRGFGYPTASSTPEAPRERLFFELDRAVDREERIRLGLALQGLLEEKFPAAIRFDESVYRAEQPNFCPVGEVRPFFFTGDPVEVEWLLSRAPAVARTEARAERLDTIASNDPVLTLLNDRGMVKSDRQDGGYNVICPRSAHHTSESGETATVYYPRNTGGFASRRFKCLHSHCQDAPQEAFYAALGIDPPWVKATPEDIPQASPAGSSGAALRLIRASSVRSQPVRWIWLNMIAAGKIHILAGRPGIAKSTCAFDIAARVTTGADWPDGTPGGAPGNVLIWSGEDAIEDTINPRLEAAGADMSRIYYAPQDVLIDGNLNKRPFDVAKDLDLLEEAARAVGNIRLVIIDSIVSVAATDSHRNAETRRDLQPVKDMAERLDAAVLGISHFTKGTQGGDPVERVTGSLAFGALARVVFAAVRDRSDSTRLLFVRAKSNIGPSGGGIEYSVRLGKTPDGIPATHIHWGELVDGEAHSIITDAEGADADDVPELDRAKWFLHKLVRYEPMLVADIKKAAEAETIKWRTVERAKKLLRLNATKTGGPKSPWAWAPPDYEAKP